MAESMMMDGAGALEAGGAALLDLWIDQTLAESLPQAGYHCEAQRELRRAAAQAAVAELAPAKVGLGARMIALQFVCAHTAGLDYQAQAFAPHLPADARAISQRFATQLMGLSGRQLGVLNRLEAERRRDADAAARRALMERQYSWKKEAGVTKALADGMDRFLRSPQAMEAALTGAPLCEAPPAAKGNGSKPGASNGAANNGAAPGTGNGSATGLANGAGPVSEMPLSRQQRRALARQEKKAAQKQARQAAAAAA